MPMDPKDFQKIPVSKATRPPTQTGRHWVQVNSWWAVTEDDCLLLYCGSRQCNADRRVVEHVMGHEGHPGVKAVHLPLVFL